MKKVIAFVVCFSILVMSACSKPETTITRSDGETVTTSSSEREDTSETVSNEDVLEADGDDGMSQIAAMGDVEVDQGLLNVELTFPAGLLGEVTQEELDQKVNEDDGCISSTLNDDGSITYVFTHNEYEEFMAQTVAALDQSFQETVDSEDFPNIISITHNYDFTDFTVEYGSEEVGFDSMIIFQFYLAGGMYGVFTGEQPENIYVCFVISESGEIILETNSRDMAQSSEGSN